MNSRFSTYNPLINFIFFIAAVILGMIFQHPLFLAISLVSSILFYITICGKSAFKLIAMLIPIFALVTITNPLVSTGGETVLFTYFGRNFTLEALVYGLIFATMLSSMIIWFASYNQIMTSDKFVYIFGPIIPAISLIFTMVLRFVPNYRDKAKQISTARMCIGKYGAETRRIDKLSNATAVLSSLTTWAFESGITTANSMKSRGYGSAKRTNYSIYKFGTADILLSVLMILLFSITIIASVNGGMDIEVIPKIIMSDWDNTYTIIGAISYTILLLTPTIINVREVILWQTLKSKI